MNGHRIVLHAFCCFGDHTKYLLAVLQQYIMQQHLPDSAKSCPGMLLPRRPADASQKTLKASGNCPSYRSLCPRFTSAAAA